MSHLFHESRLPFSGGRVSGFWDLGKSIVGIVVFVGISQRRRAEAADKAAQGCEPDDGETVYNDNQAETEKEFEVAFDNPVFDANQMGIALSDDFDDSYDEQVAL
jgi:hypothetical protein